MKIRHALLLATSVGVLTIAIACAQELPPPEAAAGAGGSSGSGGSDGGAGSGGGDGGGGSGGAAGSCTCSPDHATGSCSSGSCAIVECDPGFGDCDNEDSNGCEEPLNVDGNCGACGRSCLGTACVAGNCAATTLLSGLTDPVAVIVDDSSIYLSDLTLGTIDRASKTDGSGRTTLAGGYPSTWFMVIDGEYLYFSTRYGKTVERVRTDGSSVAETFLSPQVKTSGLAVDAGYIYFTESEPGGFVWRAAKKKGAVAKKLVTQQDSPYDLAIDDVYAYWGGTKQSNGEIRRVAKNATPGMLPGQQVATGQGIVRAVVIDSQMVFWTSVDSGFGRVTRYNIATTKVDILAITEPAEFLAVDETYLYWAASDSEAGYIYRLEKDHDASQQPAPVVKLYSEPGTEPYSVAVDATALYFTERGKGRVLRVAK